MYVGAHNIQRPSEERRRVHLATKSIVHENYNETTLQNDVAVIRTLSTIQFNGEMNKKNLLFAPKSES